VRRLFVAALLALLPVPVLLPPTSAAAAPVFSWGDWHTYPANRTVGTDRYDAGTWSYTDRYGDGLGANTDGKHREDYFAGVPDGQLLTYDAFGVHRFVHNGDYSLPDDDARFPEGSGDIDFVQLHPSADGLDVRVVLTSLGAADAAVLTLGLNTTGGSASTPFPRNARLGCSTCGIDRFVTVWGTGSEVATGGGAVLGTVSDQHVDLTENVLTFRVPAALLGPLGPTMRVWLAAGLDDAASPGTYLTVQPSQSSTTPGGGTATSPNVFDLAFVTEDRAHVDDRVQADLLAAGDAAPAAATVSLTDLATGVSRTEGEPTSGPVERTLVSSLNLGEGIGNGTTAAAFQTPEAGSNYHYLGRLQPYLVYLPKGYQPAAATPEVMVLHGFNGYYDEAYFLAPDIPPLLDRRGWIGVYPLGRGDIQYEHDGELDLLEVQRDVAATYPVDRTRVHVAGVSMGGFGATKAVIRHPDVFADGGVFVGGEDQDTDVVNDGLTHNSAVAVANVLPNLQDTPVFLGAGAFDFDSAGTFANAYYEQLKQLGDEAHVRTYLEKTHEYETLTEAIGPLEQMWSRSVLTPVPAQVTYSFDTTWWQPAGALTDDSAYWVSGLRPRSGTQARIDAEALTLPRTLTALSETVSTGGDPAVRGAYDERDALRSATGTRPVRNALTTTLTGLATGAVDLAPLHVDQTHRYCLDLTSDGATTLRLTGLDLHGQTLTGVPGTLGSDGATLQVPSGHTAAVIAPAGVAPEVGAACTAYVDPTAAAAELPEAPLPALLAVLGAGLGALLLHRARRARRVSAG